MGRESKRILGLDALRFVLASVVVLGHITPFPESERRDGVWLLFSAARNLANGPAAVIAFFIISGLCIHYPNREKSSVRTLPFYVRREIRIVVPAAVTLLACRLLHGPIDSLQDGSFWSLLCEEVYYFLYPLLLALFRRFGVHRLIVLSYVVAYTIVVFVRIPYGNYIDYGWRLTWLLGLPCWLLGCALAEQIDDRADPRKATAPQAIWTMRSSIFAVSVVLSVLRFHSPFHYGWTLDLFALPCFFWLRAEVFYYGTRTAPKLEHLGAGSYSLYLTHPLSHMVWVGLGLPNIHLLVIPFAYGAAYVFYRLVEKPSHLLARSAERMLSRPRVATGGVEPG